MSTITNEITEITDAMRFAEARRLRMENGSTIEVEKEYETQIEETLLRSKRTRQHRHPLFLEAETLQRSFLKHSGLTLNTTVFKTEDMSSINVVDENNTKLASTVRCTTPLQKKVFDRLMLFEAMDTKERLELSQWDTLLKSELHEIVLNSILDSSILKRPITVNLTDDMFTVRK